MRSWGSVGHYIQGPGVLADVRRYADRFGSNHLFLVDSFVQGLLAPVLYAGYEDGAYQTVLFEGEISHRSIEEVSARIGSADAIIAVGGGKVIDVAKMIASERRIALVVCPTIASTDAPTSAMSILYSDEGEMNEIVIHRANPDLVLVDTKVISAAPRRFLVAGIGDALSTYYEGLSNERMGHANYVWCDTEQGRATLAGRAIARACADTLFRDGPAALIACDVKAPTPAFENVVEANVLLSGIGFENAGCSIAHAIGNAITAIPEGERAMHGERVAFGTLCLLIAEDYPDDEIGRVLDLCVACGLPITFEALGLDPSQEDLEKIAEAALAAESWSASPADIHDVAGVVSLMRAANALGMSALG